MPSDLGCKNASCLHMVLVCALTSEWLDFSCTFIISILGYLDCGDLDLVLKSTRPVFFCQIVVQISCLHTTPRPDLVCVTEFLKSERLGVCFFFQKLCLVYYYFYHFRFLNYSLLLTMAWLISGKGNDCQKSLWMVTVYSFSL